MTSKRQRYLLVWLILLACGLIPLLGKQPARAASATPALPPGLTAVTQPAPMPTFHLSSFKEGSTLRSADLQGKVVVIRFWATW